MPGTGSYRRTPAPGSSPQPRPLCPFASAQPRLLQPGVNPAVQDVSALIYTGINSKKTPPRCRYWALLRRQRAEGTRSRAASAPARL